MAKTAGGNGALKVEQVPLSDLKPHPRNYRSHPDKQLEHLIRSQDQFGIYKPIVIAEDGTVLAGHGVMLAAKRRGEISIACVRMPLKPNEPAALKLMAGDNEVSRIAEDADRQLTELLKEIGEAEDLLGTGYDAESLAALVFTTRDRSEIADFDEAAEWAGMPGYENPPADDKKITVRFLTIEALEEFIRITGLKPKGAITNSTLSAWWPPKEREKEAHLKFEDGAADE